jgi:hypothetical protein
MMRADVEARLTELRGELEAGQRALAELNAKKLELEATLLRISGAAQVLHELLEADDDPGDQPLSPEPLNAGGPLTTAG